MGPLRDRVAQAVSIRAPARGATASRLISRSLELFQSAPPHGERPLQCAAAVRLGCFNPRPRTGSDPSGTARCAVPYCFNPRPRTGSDMTGDVFQSAPPHGERRGPVSIRAPARGATAVRVTVGWGRAFQSAPPHGERQAATATADDTTCFNPRPRTGSDLHSNLEADREAVSIRAPARGATTTRA